MQCAEYPHRLQSLRMISVTLKNEKVQWKVSPISVSDSIFSPFGSSTFLLWFFVVLKKEFPYLCPHLRTAILFSMVWRKSTEKIFIFQGEDVGCSRQLPFALAKVSFCSFLFFGLIIFIYICSKPDCWLCFVHKLPLESSSIGLR